MSVVKVSFVGFEEFREVMREMQSDFNETDQKKILTNAVKKAMQPVLNQAKVLAPVDTGALRASLRIEGRKPNRRDKKSIYVSPSDVVIGTVTTAPGNVLKRTKFLNVRNYSDEGPVKPKKVKGIPSDARAIANEFGTVTKAAKPFLRPALESTGAVVIDDLAGSLRQAMQKYRSRK